MSETQQQRAIIYTRISSDPEGREVGVDRQRKDCQALAKRLGMEVAEVITDNDTSASTASTKPRPQYEAMLARARRGEFSAILAYSNSRLTRRPREFEDLLELHRLTGVRISTVVSGEDNLSTADGRMVARFKAVADAAEAERVAERVRRAKAQNAIEGRYRGGRRPFGFRKDGVTHRASEAQVIRDATKAVLAGRGISAVARELNAQGSRTSTGAEWNHKTIRDVLMRPRNAGLIHTGRINSRNVQIIGKAEWEPIVSEDEWRALHTLFTEPSRVHPDHNSDVRWLGSGIYLCGLCGAVMRTSPIGGTRKRQGQRAYYYRCSKSNHLMVKADRTDGYVLESVAELVRDPRVVAAMMPALDDRQETDRERRTVLVTRLDQFENDYAQGNITGVQLAKATQAVQAELTEIETRLAEGAQNKATNPVAMALDPGQAFLDAPVDIQRAVLRAVVRVEIDASPKRGMRWTSDRVRILPVR